MLRTMQYRALPPSALFCAWLWIAGCGDDEGNAADQVGVGAACSPGDPCPKASRNGAQVDLTCIQAFRGGYCGIKDCQADTDCPDGSACVNHDDGSRYCFRTCLDKSECNRNRDAENESNCSSNVDFAQATTDAKACVPPSSS
jgi:hypothetical protein